jgi:hypothetical protein
LAVDVASILWPKILQPQQMGKRHRIWQTAAPF